MANRKISDLTALTTPASGDYLPIVDISEAAAADKNKRITVEELMRGVPSGTAGAPGIAFEADPNTGIYSPGADQLALSTNGIGRLFVDASGNIIVNGGGQIASKNVGASPGLGRVQLGDSGAWTVEGLDTGYGGSGAYLKVSSGASERLRIDSSGRLLVGTSSQANTGGTLCVNNGIGIVNNTTARFATVEHGNGASGSFTTITISATVQSSDSSVIFETLMTGFSGVYLDNVSAQYSNQAAVTMRNNASAGTSAALAVNGAGTTYTLTITTSVTHPVVKVKVTAGGLAGDITLPTITFA